MAALPRLVVLHLVAQSYLVRAVKLEQVVPVVL
jgi:hypothetical protein